MVFSDFFRRMAQRVLDRFWQILGITRFCCKNCVSLIRGSPNAGNTVSMVRVGFSGVGAASCFGDEVCVMTDSAKWYAARTKPRQDETAVRNLRQQNFEVYSPKIKIERLKKSKIIEETEPFFPGYVLICCALSASVFRIINSTRGVISLLHSSENNLPTPLPDDEVRNLKQREISGDLFYSEVKRINVGDRVKFKYGCAVDRIGRVRWTRGERVELLLYLLGRQTRVQAPLHSVERVARTHHIQHDRAVVR